MECPSLVFGFQNSLAIGVLLSLSFSFFSSVADERKTINAMKENRHRKRSNKITANISNKAWRKKDRTKKKRRARARSRTEAEQKEETAWAAHRNQITLQDTSCFNTNTCVHAERESLVSAECEQYRTHSSLLRGRWWWRWRWSTCSQKSIWNNFTSGT